MVIRAALVVLLTAGCGGGARPATRPEQDTVASSMRELETRCARGEGQACHLASEVLKVGAPGVPKDPARAVVLRERGSDLIYDACMVRRDPDLDACRLLVVSVKLAFAHTTDPAERGKLTTAFVNAGTHSCHAGDFETCIDVAAVFHEGQGVPVDQARARELVGFACTRDHQPACIQLALALVNHPTDARDRERAGALLEAACTKSDADGCEMLATYRLSEGPGAAAGSREAARRSCELGDAGGCAIYGHTLLDAIGGPADPTGARTAFETACRGKDPRGCQMIGQSPP